MKVQVNITLDVEVVIALRKYAKKEDIKMSHLINSYLRNYLKLNKKK